MLMLVTSSAQLTVGDEGRTDVIVKQQFVFGDSDEVLANTDSNVRVVHRDAENRCKFYKLRVAEICGPDVGGSSRVQPRHGNGLRCIEYREMESHHCLLADAANQAL